MLCIVILFTPILANAAILTTLAHRRLGRSAPAGLRSRPGPPRPGPARPRSWWPRSPGARSRPSPPTDPDHPAGGPGLLVWRCPMDPDEALRQVIDGLDRDDEEAALLGLTDYSVWVSRGGFPAGDGLVGSLEDATGRWADRLDNDDGTW